MVVGPGPRGSGSAKARESSESSGSSSRCGPSKPSGSPNVATKESSGSLPSKSAASTSVGVGRASGRRPGACGVEVHGVDRGGAQCRVHRQARRQADHGPQQRQRGQGVGALAEVETEVQHRRQPEHVGALAYRRLLAVVGEQAPVPGLRGQVPADQRGRDADRPVEQHRHPAGGGAEQHARADGDVAAADLGQDVLGAAGAPAGSGASRRGRRRSAAHPGRVVEVAAGHGAPGRAPPPASAPAVAASTAAAAASAPAPQEPSTSSVHARRPAACSASCQPCRRAASTASASRTGPVLHRAGRRGACTTRTSAPASAASRGRSGPRRPGPGRPGGPTPAGSAPAAAPPAWCAVQHQHPDGPPRARGSACPGWPRRTRRPGRARPGRCRAGRGWTAGRGRRAGVVVRQRQFHAGLDDDARGGDHRQHHRSGPASTSAGAVGGRCGRGRRHGRCGRQLRQRSAAWSVGGVGCRWRRLPAGRGRWSARSCRSARRPVGRARRPWRGRARWPA